MDAPKDRSKDGARVYSLEEYRRSKFTSDMDRQRKINSAIKRHPATRSKELKDKKDD